MARDSSSSAEVDSSDADADGVRRKYLYRKLIMNQGVKLPARLAMKLVGPDCAYHLYRQHNPDKKRK